MFEIVEKRHLLLSKYLFSVGQKQISRTDPMAAALAVSLFHDSVEMLATAALLKYDAPTGKGKTFMDLLGSIKEAKSSKVPVREFPLTRNMKNLNDARVGFKHHGNLPDPSEARKFETYTEAFLRETMEVFFGQNFDTLSLADLVESEYVREKLKKAEGHAKAGEFRDCVQECAEIEYEITASFDLILPKPDDGLSKIAFVVPSRRHGISAKERPIVNTEAFKYVHHYLSALRESSIIALTGIKLTDYLRFKGTVPNLLRMDAGNFVATHKRLSYGKEDAELCLRYAIDYALSIQTRLV